MKRFLFVGLFGLLCLLTFSTALADKGMIAPVLTYEPGQKAIIAWDGENEVLILSTDVYASENSWVLEILPLPSMPTVKGGTRESFEETDSLIASGASTLLNNIRRQEEFNEIQKTLAMLFTLIIAGLSASLIAIYRLKVSAIIICLLWIIGSVFGFAIMILQEVTRLGIGGTMGVEMLFHENIGAHDITVTRADNASELIGWAENYLENLGITYNLSPTGIGPLVENYIENGTNYFVFDLINLGTSRRSVDPIVYKFRSDNLYYPLKISSLASGTTEITIVTITKGELNKQQIENAGLSIKYSGMKHSGVPLEFDVSKDKLGQISPDVAELFDNNARLTALTFEGSLADLGTDLRAGVTEVSGAVLGGVDTAQVIFWAAIICVWAFIIALTYRVLAPQKMGEQLIHKAPV